MKFAPIHTTNLRAVERVWQINGGVVEPISCTGEIRFVHKLFTHPLRINGRRKDVPAKLLSRVNQLLRAQAANDPTFSLPGQ